MSDNELASKLALNFLGQQKNNGEPSEYFDRYQQLTKTFLALIKEEGKKNPSPLEIL
ncbi:TPA: hypothetical protein ACIU15_000053 [Yersinia enterocolitica]|uniref:Uncharacterized protein n=2 Tax=Yersinia TaxID=629 RepID=A0A0T9LS75_YERIN|nr:MULTISPECIES: hypothetical protein [Yersinia]ELI8129999.1 hypothetical protein [Yersinia enterocolitica]ELW8194516.1 hypothetical protein [Yersinia enterocolitica]UWM44690.1 hypothetical protein N0H69_18860 [Yersinia alsatica]CNF19772.1 Uncharacterised protein [Yersinia intermedia]CNF21174.1 Uncharacterised protein [Yersinia enterocolitica]